MQERHQNEELYFYEQSFTAQKYIIPFIEEFKAVNSETLILEVGTNKGGNMEEFLKRDCKVVGVDINEPAIKFAQNKFKSYIDKQKAEFIFEDIYNYKTAEKFDLIFMKDTIEHIPNQEKLMSHLKYYLKSDGIIFIQFPPWYMPFGGHQQIMESKFSKIPYIHLFPTFLYKFLMKIAKEDQSTIDELLYIKRVGISIDRLKRILKSNNYQILKSAHYFINPNYEVKFKLKPRVQWAWVSSIPFLRNFVITSSYYIVSSK